MPSARSLLGTAAIVIAPLLLVISIWWPLWQYYHVPAPDVAAKAVASMRTLPSDERLVEVDRQAQGIRLQLSDAEVLRQAGNVVAGRLELPDGEVRTLRWPFDIRDYDGGTPGGALNMASLVVPDALMRAHELSGDDAPLNHARNALLAFIAFEADLRGDAGFVRNDHAIAARVGVMVRFWRLYRHRADADPAVLRAILAHAQRCAAFLAKPTFYTAATNHGVMQNIALLQAAVAFPDLEGTRERTLIARHRLAQQMAYFMNDEGVVLEHSPGYHRFGVRLVDMIEQLLAWTGQPPIPGLAEKQARARLFLARLKRPDGSLPRLGDTNAEPEPADAVNDRHDPVHPARDPARTLADGTHVYEVAGYALTRRALPGAASGPAGVSHSMLAWSRFPKHGHEVAAEGSFLLWAAGTDWIGNTGYWPYGTPGRADSEGWRGSNAPHRRADSMRTPSQGALLGVASDAQSHLLDYARTLEGDGPTLRRQVLQVDAMNWVVVDSVSRTIGQPIDRLWTLPPHVRTTGSGNAVLALDPSTGWSLQVTTLGDPPPEVRSLSGSLQPFGGWMVVASKPERTRTLEVVQPAGARWVATVFSLLPPGSPPLAPPVARFHDDGQWSVTLDPGGTSSLQGRRVDNTVLLGAPGSAPRRLPVEAAAAATGARAALAQALDTALKEYPRFQPLVYYRLRLSAVLLALALAAWAVSAGLVRRGRCRLPAVAGVSCALWTALAGWIHLAYLVK
jgi:hypothetical protein